ncbi:MAG: cyclodeaminase/cyclohydrolase family protein, partial [Planctomycetota bacterium]
KQQRSVGVSDRELIKIAVKTMGLDELSPFDANEKIIEYAIADGSNKQLVDLSLRDFVEETASESPAPGGGSVAAALGALGAALGTMVANLSSHKRGWDDRWEEFSRWADRGKAVQDELVRLVDADTDAFNAILAAFRLPKSTPEESQARADAIEAANRGAIEVPLRVMETALEAMPVLRAMATDGMKQSASDAGVGALCVRGAVLGAGLNVRINLSGLKDEAAAAEYRSRAETLTQRGIAEEAAILELVEARL